MSTERGGPDAIWHRRPMTEDDVAGVLEVERTIYPFPWGVNHFVDSLRSGYDAWVVEPVGRRMAAVGEPRANPLAYCVMMWVVDETHLLNISVAADQQHRGLARWLLGKLFEDSRRQGARSMLLEVRPSNPRARRLYERAGFDTIGVRRGYYPWHDQQREDAIVMRCLLAASCERGLGGSPPASRLR